MEYAHLGRSGLLVSRIALGTMNFGFTADEAASFEILDAAVETGINFIDTADVYGGPQTPDMAKGFGISEEIIGKWLKRSGRRDDIVLATKAYQHLCSGLGHAPAEVALAWLVHQPVVPATIVGPRTPSQLESSERAVSIELDGDTLAELDRLWPGPGDAPQAYAW